MGVDVAGDAAVGGSRAYGGGAGEVAHRLGLGQLVLEALQAQAADFGGGLQPLLLQLLAQAEGQAVDALVGQFELAVEGVAQRAEDAGGGQQGAVGVELAVEVLAEHGAMVEEGLGDGLHGVLGLQPHVVLGPRVVGRGQDRAHGLGDGGEAGALSVARTGAGGAVGLHGVAAHGGALRMRHGGKGGVGGMHGCRPF